MERRTSARPLVLVVSAGLAVSAALHGVLIGPHMHEAWQFGAFFIASTAALGLLAAAVAVAPTRMVLISALVLAVTMIATWALFRIVPPPFGEGVEEIDALGLWCKGAEVLVVAGCLSLLRRRRS